MYQEPELLGARKEEKMEGQKIDDLKTFVDYCKQNPTVLHSPNLIFFKNYLHSLGARIPAYGDSGGAEVDDQDVKPFPNRHPYQSKDESNEDIVESDVELDNSEVVKPDNDPPQKMGDSSIEVTEENQEAAQLSKAKAMEMIADGRFVDAIDHLTEAIILNPMSAIFYANRASVFVKLKRPSAAIRDADVALKLNPDSAKGYKARGMARALLGLWEEAASDLRLASTLDFDVEIGSILKKVEPNVKKIEEHRRKYERLRKEKEIKTIRSEKQKHQAKSEAQNAEAASAFTDGEVFGIHSARELKTKLTAASDASRLSVIYFTAKWCGPCRYISPEISSLAKKFPKVVFLKVDIDEAADAATERDVSSVPTFFLMKKGREVDRIVGANKVMLEMKIAQHAAAG